MMKISFFSSIFSFSSLIFRIIWLLIIFSLFISSSFGLYEDEIGKFDWYLEKIGTVEKTLFEETRRPFFVSTSSNVLAKIQPKNGQLIWRQVFAEEDKIHSVFQDDKKIVLFSGIDRQYLRGFDKDGLFLWEELISSTNKFSDIIEIPDNNKDGIPDFALISSSVIQIRSGKEGKLLWKKERKNPGYGFNYLGIYNNRLLATQISNQDLIIERFSLTNETSTIYNPFLIPEPFTLISFLKNNVLLLGKSGLLHYINLATNVLNSIDRTQLSEIKSIEPLFNDYVAIISNKKGAIVQFSEGNKHTIVKEFEGEILFSSFQYKNNHYIGVCRDKEISIIHLATLKTEFSFRLEEKEDHGDVEKFFVNLIEKKNESLTHRVLAVYEDESISFFQEGTLIWEREESLASINHVETMDLPSSHVFDNVHFIDEHTLNFVNLFMNRLQIQLQDFQALFSNHLNSLKPKSNLTKDRFGFKQLILVSTKAGKVFAIYTESGEIVWKKFFPGQDFTSLTVTRTSTFYPPECLLLTKTTGRWINPLTGEQNRQVTFPFQIEQLLVLPHTDKSGNQVLVAIDQSLKLHVLGSQEEFEKKANTTFFYFSYSLENKIVGYTVGNKEGDNTYSSIQVWQTSFPTSETISTIVPSSLHSQVTPAVRVLGDRSILARYLNPNTIYVVTEKNEMKSVPTSSIFVYIIDSITGAILHRIYHNQACGPVELTQHENLVIYHYFNIADHRFELSVLELFEPELDWKGTSISSFSRPKPIVHQKSYIVQTHIRTMSFTKTARGLTTPQALLGLSSGQILGLTKNWLDPRRPLKFNVSESDKEEGLIPYEPYLPTISKSMINYYKVVHNIRNIVTIPAYLESTCLVFAYGLDIFFTRTTPSNNFDVLDESFNYEALVLTSLTLLILTIVSSWISHKREITRLWR